jgi:hypothetical protein
MLQLVFDHKRQRSKVTDAEIMDYMKRKEI